MGSSWYRHIGITWPTLIVLALSCGGAVCFAFFHYGTHEDAVFGILGTAIGTVTAIMASVAIEDAKRRRQSQEVRAFTKRAIIEAQSLIADWRAGNLRAQPWQEWSTQIALRMYEAIERLETTRLIISADNLDLLDLVHRLHARLKISATNAEAMCGVSSSEPPPHRINDFAGSFCPEPDASDTFHIR